MFILGFIAVIVVGATKLYDMYNGNPYRLVTESPYFYLALTTMILGTQLFLAGFIGELIARNAPERNNYQIEKELLSVYEKATGPIIPALRGRIILPRL